eukprot:4388038-Pyramimonas_sp.AAC.1
MGVFFVRKKSGRLRLIVDARAANQSLKSRASIQLASTAAIVGLEAEPGDKLEFSILGHRRLLLPVQGAGLHGALVRDEASQGGHAGREGRAGRA